MPNLQNLLSGVQENSNRIEVWMYAMLGASIVTALTNLICTLALSRR